MDIGRIAFIIVAAFALDCIIGDPQNPAHPIRLIGGLIAFGVSGYKRLRYCR